LVGTPVRPDLFGGNAEAGRAYCGFNDDKPILLVMGGSQGAQRINDALKAILPELLKQFNVVHLTGKGKSIGFSAPGYCGFEFIGEQLKDLFAASCMVVSRAGANSIFELLALRKPMLLIPLEIGSRGDQILNANSFEAKGWARQVKESTMTENSLLESILSLFGNRQSIIREQETAAIEAVPKKIVQILLDEAIPVS
jgi:UDP-N-acetylglucosamine--N-acetylmuramyl-(pentapeptide) pyrophosphoryl-undecaprenol N-acetylglucosamine transferase